MIDYSNLKSLGYKIKKLTIRGIKVVRITLPKNVKLTSKHPFRDLQIPENQLADYLK